VDQDVVILGGARTPIGRLGGSLKPTNAVALGAVAVRGALERTGAPADQVDLCVMGHARQAGNGPNPGRLMAIGGGLPAAAPAHTTQQACISGLLAVMQARYAIREGDASLAVAGGAEHMSSIPYFSFETRWGTRMGHAMLVDGMVKDGFIDPLTGKHMGELADRLARRYEIDRQAQDAYALESQRRAAAALEQGHLKSMVVPVAPADGQPAVTADEHPRPDTTLDKLAKLPPAFGKDGTITAGNASGITDGACALVLASARRASNLGLRPRARILGACVAAVEPEEYAIAPVHSSRVLLERLGLSMRQMDVVELNEAFAAQVLACAQDLDLDRDRLNVWGGAIALGHPIGMSGARILLYLLHALEAVGGRYGLATLCGNGGHGGSVVIERMAS
jgi:acetyl-CoA C-acetyltransferase